MARNRNLKKGSARMRELGHVSVTIWLNPRAIAQLDRVRGYRPRAKWVGHMVHNAIRQVMQTLNGVDRPA